MRRLLLPPGELEQAAPELDPPDPAPLGRVLIIATNPRTGSTLLSRGLAATDLAGRPREYLHGEGHLAWRRRWGVPVPTARGAAGMLKRRMQRDPDWTTCYRWRPESMRRLLDLIVAHRTTSNGVFATKVHAMQHRDWTRRTGLDLRRWGDGSVPVSWVRLEREDVVAQAVSHAIASLADGWTSEMAARAEPVYSADVVGRSLDFMMWGRRHWDDYFAETGIEPLAFTYEYFAAHYEESMRAVLALLGETVDEVPPPQVERQAGARNREWIERFSQDRPEAVLAARAAAT